MKQKDKEYTELLHGKELSFELSILDEIYNATEGLDRSHLVEIFQVERRTLYKSIENLNIFSLKKLNQEAILLNSKNNYIFNGGKEELSLLKVELFETSPAILLAKQLLSKPEVNLQTFCIDNYIGESTLRRKIKNANRFLMRFDMQLIIRKQHIQLTGDEIAIRHGLISFFWMTYHGLKWPFTFLPKEVLDKKLSTILPSTSSINESKREQFMYILAIMYSRIKLKKHVYTWGIPLHYEIILVGNSLFDNFKNICEKNFNFPDREVKFFFLFLLTLPDFYVIFKDALSILDRFKLSDYPLYENIFYYFQFLKQKHPDWSLKSENNNYFLAVLLAGIMNIDIFKGKSISIDNSIFQDHLDYEFPNLKASLKSFIKETPNSSLITQIDLLSLTYIRSYVMIFPPHDFEEPIYLLINTDMPMYIEKYIIHTLYNILYSKFNIHFINSEENIEPDLILSTSLALTPKTLLINPEVTDKDILNVFHACDEIRKDKSNFVM